MDKLWAILFILVMASGGAWAQAPTYLQGAAQPGALAVPNATPQTDANGKAVMVPFVSSAWVPALTFGGTAVGLTCAACGGTYTQIGKRVIFDFQITLSALGSSTGSAVVSGLPIASTSATGQGTVSCGYYVGMATATGIAGAVNSGSTTITLLIPQAVSSPAATQANFTSSSQINCSGSYQAG